MTRTDVIIIGAGPAGLFAAFYAGMRHLTTEIIDTLPQAGGQPFALYPQKQIYDIGGIPNITGQILSENSLKQLAPFKETTTFHLNEQVLAFKKIANKVDAYFQVTTTKGYYESKALLIATGGGAFSPRLLKAEGVDTLPQDKLTYIAKPYSTYRNKTLAILGGGDTALDYAYEISEYAKKIYLIHRRDRFRGLEYQLTRLQQHTNVEKLTPYLPKRVQLTNQNQVTLTLEKARTTDTKTITVDEVLVSYGFVGSQSEMKAWPIDLENQTILVNQMMMTTTPGVFAIGDIATYSGKTKLIASAYGEAPTAINGIAQYLNPKDPLHMIHSTTFFGSH